MDRSGRWSWISPRACRDADGSLVRPAGDDSNGLSRIREERASGPDGGQIARIEQNDARDVVWCSDKADVLFASATKDQQIR